MAEDGAQPAVRGIRLDKNWRVFDGCAYGLDRQTAFGHAQVALPRKYRVQILRNAVEATLRCEAPKEIVKAPGGREAAALAHFGWVVSEIRRYCKIGVSRQVHLASLDYEAAPAAGTPRRFRLALPYSSGDSLGRTLAFTLRLFDGLLDEAATAAQFRAQIKAGLPELERHLRPAAETGQNRSFFQMVAADRGIPSRSVVKGVYDFGTGRFRRRLHSSITERTSGLGGSITANKIQTAQALRAAGLPGAVHRLVGSLEAALQAAEALGYPVVLKPSDKEGGQGVFAGLRAPDSVRKYYPLVRKVSPNVLVEKHFEGNGHRFTLFEGAPLLVTVKYPGGVVGDGGKTIRTLVEEAAAARTASRSSGEPARPPLTLDDEAMDMLAEAGLTPESVPARGQRVNIRRRNNAVSGGITYGLEPEDVHPDNLSLALQAAAEFNLDFAGVDLLTPDISRSWLEAGALICEINTQPQVGIRAANQLFDRLFPGGHSVPAHLVACWPDAPEAPAERHLGSARDLGCSLVSAGTGLWRAEDGYRLTGEIEGGSWSLAALAPFRNEAADGVLSLVSVAELLARGAPLGRHASLAFDGPVPEAERAAVLALIGTNCAAPEGSAGPATQGTPQ
jgi:hypothetical protein